MDPSMQMVYQQRMAGLNQARPQRPFPDPTGMNDPMISTIPQLEQQRESQGSIDKAAVNRASQALNSTRPDPYKKLPITTVSNDVQDKNLQQYLHRDKMYQKSLETQHKRHMQLAHSKKAQLEMASMEKKARQQGMPVFGPGYKGFGNTRFAVQQPILYPRDKRKQKRMTHISHNMRAISAQADEEDVLVPVRIDMESNGYQLRDTFTWNLNEKILTPEKFADILCEDLHLPAAQFAEAIVTSIREQLEEYHLYAPNTHSKPSDVDASTDKVELSTGSDGDQAMVEATESTEASVAPTTTESSSASEDDLRIVIKLDITVGNISLVDQFEWSVENSSDSPEIFAEKLVNELGLGGEFRSAIAHSIREQVYVHFKSLLIGQEYGDGSYLSERVKTQLLPNLKYLLRDPLMAEKFTPVLLEISDLELDRIEREKLREFRRKRRQNRSSRRGMQLPDREALRTHRTGVAIPQTTDANEDGLGSGIENGRGGDTSWYGRKSALKARMNIAAEARMSGYRDSLSPVPTNSQLENGLPLTDGMSGFGVGRPYGNPYQGAGLRDAGRDSSGLDANGGYDAAGMDPNHMYPTPTPRNVPKPEAELPEGCKIAEDLLDWMPSKKRILESRNPHDVFDIVQLENGDYKVFCYDCPNKLYTIGPNETLKNFEVHLRNRSHRNSVEARLRAAW